MQQIILNENVQMQDMEIRKLNSFCTKINNVLPEFEVQTGYKLTMPELRTLFERSDLDELINHVNQSIESGLKGIKITGIVRKTFTGNTAEFVYSFADKLKGIYQLNDNNNFRNLSIENGLLCLSSEAENAIRKNFIDVIATERGKEFYELHLAAAKSFSELGTFIKVNTPINFITVAEMSNALFSLEKTGKIEINKNINYDFAAKETL